MPIVYFDSSAFVKLIVDEDGSDVAATLWDGCDLPVSSSLAYPEVRAAVAAAGRAGRLTPAEQRWAERLWETYWDATRTIAMSDRVTRQAGRLAGVHVLRGADAVHLASILTLGAADTVLAVWDHRLRVGAQAAGVRVAPVE